MQVTLSGFLSQCIGFGNLCIFICFYPLTFELAMVICRKGEKEKENEPDLNMIHDIVLDI